MAKEKDPAVLWYWDHWFGGTFTMSRHLKGCYMDLLYAQFNTGHLSLDEIKTVLGSDYGSSWPTIQKKFATDDNGLYYNKRAKKEKERRESFSLKQSSNGSQTKAKLKPDGSLLVNENINENEISNSLKEGAEENFETWTQDVISGNDHEWEKLLMKEPLVYDDTGVKAHENKCIRENIEFKTQQHFRKSLYGYLKAIQDNKKNHNGNSTGNTGSNKIDIARAERSLSHLSDVAPGTGGGPPGVAE